MCRYWLLAIAALVCISSSANDQPLVGTVSFDAIGKPSMLKIHGEGKQLAGALKQDGKVLSGEFVARLDDLDTGMKLRNEHMKTKYLEVAKFPDAKFKLDPLSLPTEQGEFKTLPFTGKITIRGVEKQVNGTADIVIGKGKTVQSIVAAFTTKISEFNMQIPSFAGVTVAEEIQVKVMLKP